MKQLELKRISDEEIMELEVDVEKCLDKQISYDQQVLDNVKQAIFDEIKTMEAREIDNSELWHCLRDKDLQALKKRLGVK